MARRGRARGLPNLKNTVDVLPIAVRKDTIELFTKYKVYSEKELQSRFNILSETYVKTIDIEAKTAVMMAKTMILPASLKYQKEVGESIAAAKAAGAAQPAGLETFTALVSRDQRVAERDQGPGEARRATTPRARPTTTRSTCATRCSPP